MLGLGIGHCSNMRSTYMYVFTDANVPTYEAPTCMYSHMQMSMSANVSQCYSTSADEGLALCLRIHAEITSK